MAVGASVRTRHLRPKMVLRLLDGRRPPMTVHSTADLLLSSTTSAHTIKHNTTISQHTLFTVNFFPHRTIFYLGKSASPAQQTGVSLVSASAAAFSCELLNLKFISCSAIANCQRINFALFGALSVK